MFNERRIELELNAIISDIVFYGRQFNYTQHIKRVKTIIEKLSYLKANARSNAELSRLSKLEFRASMYLNTMIAYQAEQEYQR